MKYRDYFKKELALIEKTLEDVLPAADAQPAPLHEAMRYSVFPGGKRIRPVLTLAACQATGGSAKDALYPAAAVELIHSYSLVHDDLPALDNDQMRRGRLTTHKHYGEAMAILAGDGLLTLAFHSLCRAEDPVKVRELLAEISTESGSCGMIGGQVADLTDGRNQPDLPTLDYVSIHKTGKLIKASAVCGAIAAGAGPEERQHIMKYGELIGLAFQTIDDLLDGDGYMKLMKAKDLRDMARDLIAQAKREVKPFAQKGAQLIKITDYLIERIPKGNHVSVD